MDRDKKNGSPVDANLALCRQMTKVLKCHGRACQKMSPETIHDLRVAIRKCLSILKTLQALNPRRLYPKKIAAQGLRLFQHLGGLRDVEIMRVWAKQLRSPLPVQKKMREKEARQQRKTERALLKFKVSNWKKLIGKIKKKSAPLPRVQRQVLSSKHLAALKQAHARALKTRREKAWHHLRIKLKEFRYISEFFLPAFHREYGKRLALCQTCLGDYHDLGIMAEKLREDDRRLIIPKIKTEQAKQLKKYQKTASTAPWAS